MARLNQAPIAVTTAAFVPMVAKTFARYVEIQEDGLGTQSGLKVTWPNGNVDYFTPVMQPIKIGTQDGSGPLVGCPANYNSFGGVGTVYCTVEALTAATSVIISEWN
jgi:hypothetical protein